MDEMILKIHKLSQTTSISYFFHSAFFFIFPSHNSGKRDEFISQSIQPNFKQNELVNQNLGILRIFSNNSTPSSYLAFSP
jgi:hypothetical protein